MVLQQAHLSMSNNHTPHFSQHALFSNVSSLLETFSLTISVHHQWLTLFNLPTNTNILKQTLSFGSRVLQQTFSAIQNLNILLDSLSQTFTNHDSATVRVFLNPPTSKKPAVTCYGKFPVSVKWVCNYVGLWMMPCNGLIFHPWYIPTFSWPEKHSYLKKND